MIKSIKSVNGSFASLGNVQLRPLDNDSTRLSKSRDDVPFKQTTLQTTSSRVSDGNVASGLKHTVESLVSATNAGAIVPMVPSRGTSTVPSFYDPENGGEPPFSGIQLNSGQRQLAPYEQLTGIAHTRPEIIMVTNFEPLYDRSTRHDGSSTTALLRSMIDSSLTDVGEYVDLQFQMRLLQHSTLKSVVNNLISRFKVTSDAVLNRRKDCIDEIDRLNDASEFLLRVVRDIDSLKDLLDLRDSRHVIDVTNVIRTHTLNFTRVNSRSSVNVLNDYAKRYIPARFTFADTLVSLGFSNDSTMNVFSSSKLWLQTLAELRSMLVGHSRQLINDPGSAQRADRNAAVVTLPTKTFTLPTVAVRLDDVGVTKPTDVELMISKLNVDWRKFTQSDSLFSSRELKISLLLNSVCKEYRYSASLSDKNFVKFVSDEFGYEVKVGGNQPLIDRVVGDIVPTVTSVNVAASTTSLDAIARHAVADNVAVLTFESKYVENDAGLTTPGSAYYVDSLLNLDNGKFNVRNISRLQALLEQEHRRLNYVVDGMNLLGTNVVADTDKLSSKYSATISNPGEFVSDVLSLIVNKNGQTLQRTYDDVLCPLYSFAATDEFIRSALFMYTIVKILRQNSSLSTLFSIVLPTGNDNSPLLERLVNVIVGRLETVVQTTTSGGQFIGESAFNYNKSTTNVSIETIRAALKTGTVFSNSIELLMQKVLATFMHDNVALVNDTTRYSGVSSSCIMMALFDVILTMVALMSNQTITSMNVGQVAALAGTKTFNISKGNAGHLEQVNNIVERLESESARVQRTLYTVMSTLRTMADSCTGLINFVKAKDSEKTLAYVASVLNDNELLQLLVNEQQVLLLASTLLDMKSNVGDESDPYSIIDDSVVSPKMKNVIFNMFNSDEFASSKGNNKRIFTIGIPVNFSKRLQQLIDTRSRRQTFNKKENDIVAVSVYKVDVRYPDIVFNPKKFLFELSRFPVRDASTVKVINGEESFASVVKSVATRDMSETTNVHDVTYRPIDGSKLNDGSKVALDGPTYEFLTNAQKDEIIINHVTSYVLESYIKLLTSIDVGDHHFHITTPPKPVDDELVKLINEHQIVHVSTTLSSEGKKKPTNNPGVLFTSVVGGSNSSNESSLDVISDPKSVADDGSGGSALDVVSRAVGNPKQSALNVLTSPASFLNNVAPKNLDAVVASQAAVSSIGHLVSTLGTPDRLTARLLSPKQFDRVFNVVVDPDDFEVNEVETLKTQSGKQLLEQLLKSGDVLTVDRQEGTSFQFKRQVHRRPTRVVGQYTMKGKDKQSGDITFDKYFVTIETLNNGDVV